MVDDVLNVAIGGLLHDIGKLAFRSGDRRKHSVSGQELIREIGIFNDDIAECAAYHHGAELSNAKLRKDSPAYIVYIADNISSAADRRESSEEGGEETRFDPFLPLEPVFNILNDNDSRYAYEARTLDDKDGINFPRPAAGRYDVSYYDKLLRGIKDGFRGVRYSAEYVNSIADLLEGYMSFVPSSTDKKERPDISLYDHSKTTAAIACCIYGYLSERGEMDYKTTLFENYKRFYDEKCFLVFSCDMSGIQDFIYTVSGEKMLKSLRARSFYLEITLEHIIDEILSRAGIPRVNLIYSGGGHAYILLPNTKEMKDLLENMERELNLWFIQNFKTSLYIATAYRECTGGEFMNKPEGSGSYSRIFKDLTAALSAKKLRRYDAATLRNLNFGALPANHDGYRECKECKRSDRLTEEDICDICAALKEISADLTRKDFFAVKNEPGLKTLPLPLGKHLYLMDERELREAQSRKDDIVRFYGKNKFHTGLVMATNLWMGDYNSGETFEELAENARGIERIAILRADVDNLGRAFSSGFNHKKYNDRYVTLSRSAALSRQLSLFFKYHINSILKNPKFFMREEDAAQPNKKRAAIIVYSGGDDMFIVGSWNDCVELAVEVNDAFREYTQGTLSISAGIGIYQPSYPIANMARETGDFEDAAKNADERKNKVALFGKDRPYEKNGNYEEKRIFEWDVLRDKVIGEKLRLAGKFFSGSDERGKAMIYRVLGYLRFIEEDRINIARLAYMLTRLAPEDEVKKQDYAEFMRKCYGWALDKKDRDELTAALELYIYLEREKGLRNDGHQ